MVKTVSEEKKDAMSKDVLRTPKDGFIQKKKNQKFKQTPTGKVNLINGSKASNNSSTKQQLLEKKSVTPQKATEKNKDLKKKDSPKNARKQQQSKKESSKKDLVETEEDESESDEDINEGIVLQEQSFTQESGDSEDEESDEDENEEEKSLPNILGTSLADDSDEDDEDYKEGEEEDDKEMKAKKGVKMFKGLKANNVENNDDSEEEEDEDEDDMNIDDDSEEESDSVEEDEDDDDDDDEESEDEEEGDESALGLKALLGNSLADDDEDEDFVEPGENDDDSSEEEDDEEEEEDETNNSMSESPEQSKNHEENLEDSLEELKVDKNTIFVGNLPKEVTRNQLKKQFKKFGNIDTIRLRGVVAKSINVPKKVAAITKDVHPKLKSIYAYIKFHVEESAKAALSMNGELFMGNHIRVDTTYKSEESPNKKKCVFVGNLHFNTDDETFRKHFEDCGELESVRVIRDNRSGIGKGFGYINFKNEDAVALALELDGTKILNREIRVKKFMDQNERGKDRRGKRSLSADSKNKSSFKKQKYNAKTTRKGNAASGGNEKKFSGNQTSPQQSKTFQGQKADEKKKRSPNKLDKKKKILAEKLAAKPKKPSN
ncbi:uncharacterized protein LOC143350447 isoform X2 [Colletes latitarsis]|uniref:uncharacterized protein LOC143350447 isoform X2 n=1 Tax=Colletes latitarsis TaxID=2605962 RepID=UPI004035DD09